MGRTSLSHKLAEHATAALVAAVEIYNKPAFAYRENSFAILSINAWELLLKARLLALNGNRQSCLWVYESKRTRTGKYSTKQYVKRNRCNNPMTIGLLAAIDKLNTTMPTEVPHEVKRNLEALLEIRDNATHYVNSNAALGKQVLEIGAAAIANFVSLCQDWELADLSRYKFNLLPLGFVTPPATVRAVRLGRAEKNLLLHLSQLIQSAAHSDNTSARTYAALEVELKLSRTSSAGALQAVRVGPAAPNAVPVHITEEDVRSQWPWDYRELTRRLRERYSNFKSDAKYHQIRKPLANTNLVRVRYLHPGNPKSSKTSFYSSSILTEFDKHYTRR